MGTKDGLRGKFDSLKDKLSSIFGGSSPANPPSSQPEEGTETVESLCQNLGITRQEAGELLRKCGINPSAARLTHEQTARVYAAHYSASVEEYDPPQEKEKTETRPESKGRVRKEAVKIPPSEIIADFSRDFEAAREKYGGVRIAFTGNVELVRRDGEHNFAVEIASDDPAFHGKLVCRFVESMKPRLDELGLGQEVTITGWISGTDGIILQYGNDTITIGNSVIANSVPAPAKDTSSASKTVKEALSIPPSVILRDYKADSEAARKKYAGVKLLFTGAVELVRRDGENNFAVEITPDDPAFHERVICRFVKTMKPRIEKLLPKQKVTISAYMTGDNTGNDALTAANSNIVSEGAAPKISHKVRVFTITDIPETPITRASVPGEGSSVFTQDGRDYILGSAIGHGGEGTVYRISASGVVAKIYDEKHCTERRREKIKQMAESRLFSDGICFPREALYTKAGEFTGYTMQEAKGHDFAYLWREKEVFDKRFPDWKKADLVKLAVTILQKIKYLHNHDVLIGDINPLNFLFVSPSEVYFLDTDSYQFRGFPAPVGTDRFTAPELQGVDLRTVIRTQESENFSVAMFLFMLMTQGASPNAYQGGSNPASNIRNGLFPFGVGSKKVPNVWDVQPQGSVRFQWSHLMRALKEAFWDTFHAEGEHRDAAKRYTADEWYSLMLRYHKSLPGMTQEDPQSGEVFPSRLKKSSQVNYRTCEHCGEEKPEELFADDTTCRACFSKIREERNRVRNEVYATLTCQDCGEEFTITRGEYEFYTSKGLELPKRCPKCREAKKSSGGGWDL